MKKILMLLAFVGSLMEAAALGVTGQVEVTLTNGHYETPSGATANPLTLTGVAVGTHNSLNAILAAYNAAQGTEWRIVPDDDILLPDVTDGIVVLPSQKLTGSATLPVDSSKVGTATITVVNGHFENGGVSTTVWPGTAGSDVPAGNYSDIMALLARYNQAWGTNWTLVPDDGYQISADALIMTAQSTLTTTLVLKRPVVLVSTDECELTVDTSGALTALAGTAESFTIPDEVWDAAGGNPVTITFTRNGGATETLGTYRQGDPIEWMPIKGGTYAFSFGSDDYQATFQVETTPGIFITSAKQRWPWNGMVDIGYFVEGLDPEKEYTATFHVTCKGETKSFTLAGIVNGDATTAWDAAAATAWGKTLVKEPATVSADLRCLTVKEPEKWGTYMIVDLTKLGQAGCVTYETKESAEAACNAYNRDEYKTTKLVLRKVAKGQAYPVKPGETGSALMDADVMTPLKDYYIGVFMVTKAQYDYVMGTSMSSTDTLPTTSVSYNEIRKNDVSGAMSPLESVCNNSFLHRLVQGCYDKDGNPVGSFDLPTEVQWEIACRAGSFGRYGSYLDTGWNEVTANSGNVVNMAYCQSKSAPTYVGTLRPNAWGFYDMLGNLWEWCLDQGGDPAATDVETPTYTEASTRVAKGRYYVTNPQSMNPGARHANMDASAKLDYNGGFRVCHVED